MEGQFYLEHVGENQRARQRLVTLPCTVGRSSECDVRFSMERISRKHARFEKHPDGLRLVDLDTTNGTFVNLERIDKPTFISPGDSIHLADHEFRLIVDDTSGQTIVPPRRNQGTSADHTQVGFTAEPEGFPVQAPEFYELLNDERIVAQTQSVETPRGESFGWLLGAASTHPRLEAGHANLQHLARQLDEEPRLNAMIRRHALAAADQAGLVGDTLFFEIQPCEIENPDVLVDELTGLANEFRGLELVCTAAPVGIGREALETVATRLEKLGIGMGLRSIDPADPRQLSLCKRLADYVFVDSGHGIEAIRRAVEALAGKSIEVIVNRIDDATALESLRGLESILVCGNAVAEPEVAP